MISAERIKQLEHLINYQFRDQHWLIEALSHPSLKQHHLRQTSDNYQRLELLGDAVLGFIITEFLFKNFTSYDEGQLARFKATLVCKDTLCKVAQAVCLAEYLIMTHGEELSGGRTNPNNLENCLEAVIGAVYLDSDINHTRIFIKTLWQQFLANLDINYTDPKTTLQEWSQNLGHVKPLYQIIDRCGPAHLPLFTVSVQVQSYKQTGQGKSVKLAEKQAAEKLLIMIKHAQP